MYTMALFIVGFDGKDICQGEYRHYSLRVLKAAYKKSLSFLATGNIAEYQELMNTIIHGINHRVSIIMEWGNILIDAVNDKKFVYEKRLFDSLDQKRKKDLPKS